MKINQIGLSRLRNDTHFQFHTEFKDLAHKHNPQALKIKPHTQAKFTAKRAKEKTQHRRPIMTKNTFLAIAICLAMIFPSTANAGWLEIVKDFISGGIKTVIMPKTAKIAAESKPATAPAPEQSPAPKPATQPAQPSPEDIYDALNRLGSVCMDELAKYVPCAIGIEKSLSIGTAREKATAKARVELARIMGTYIEANTSLDATSEEDEDGVLKEANSYIADAKLSTKELVTGAQQYLSYTYIDEEATQINKGRTVYITTVVMVLNKELLGKALEDAAKGKPIGQQIISESKKGIVAIVKNVLKKKR
jgi:hypothetical protein